MLESLKIENGITVFRCINRIKYGCSKAQFEYLCSFQNVEMNIAQNRASNYITKKQASELIELAKIDTKIEINA